MQRIFVISDLHLGGKPGFQMCTSPGRRCLAEFIRWASAQHAADRRVRLVLAGDIVDFLAEEPFAAFTSDDAQAQGKLERILGEAGEVFDALAAHVKGGGALTLLLGNHDIELSLPGPRRTLLARLGHGDVEFLYDNQALTIGPVLIEHGNRYDPWNVVDHDRLRQLRSALSRGEVPPEFPMMAGSELVVQVMNRIKARYSFIDLLKPETDAALPFLAVLEPALFKHLSEVVRLYRQSRRVHFERDGRPKDPGQISASLADGTEEHLREAARLALGSDPGQIGAVETMGAFYSLWLAATSRDREQQLLRLLKGLRALSCGHERAWQIDAEEPVYLTPALAAAQRGFKVVIYGHTHLAKRVGMESGALYLNTGTWADLMWLPDAILTGEDEAAQEELGCFADDLADNHLDRWRRLLPTFAQIDVGVGGQHLADLFLFHGPDRVEKLLGGSLRSLRL